MAGGQINILSEEQIGLVHENTLHLLTKPGVRVASEIVLKLLADGGADVDLGARIARIPEELVEETISKVPKSITLGARDPKREMVAPRKGPPYMATNGTAVYMTDLETGAKRPTMGNDLKDFMTLCDAIDSLDYVWPIVTAHDGPERFHGLNELAIAMHSTTKHIQGEAMSAEEAKDMIRAASLVTGGEDQLAKKPIFSVIQCPICPLEFEKGSVEAVMEFAKAGIPVVSMSMALCGLTAPVALAAAISIVNAENLASFTISQLARKGAPVIYSSESSTMNMKTGEIRYGAREEVLIAAAVAQMAKHYGVPTMVGSFGMGLHGDTPGINVDPSELAFTTMTNLSLTDFSSGIGGLDQAKGAALEQIIIDTDIWESVREIRNDVEFDDKHFANELISSIGPGGNFLNSPHTIKNMRKELFLPNAEKSSIFESYRLNKDQKDILSKARERVEEILAIHKPEPIEPDISKRVKEIVDRRR
ncbi:MAG: trimethylamine methyltransferase family protein [Candidatus Thermoplasmatota archaeon]|nr:trimethylamine methyltransferase family protein [Candidatus Thermoplasmatota archaeon]